jgi:hypothetical protein
MCVIYALKWATECCQKSRNNSWPSIKCFEITLSLCFKCFEKMYWEESGVAKRKGRWSYYKIGTEKYIQKPVQIQKPIKTT